LILYARPYHVPRPDCPDELLFEPSLDLAPQLSVFMEKQL
jgi:hypothetical protein